MFVPTWIWIVLLSANRMNADGGSSDLRKRCQDGNYCVTFHGGTLKAEAGLCAVIPCSFTTASSFTPTDIIWYKCKPFQEKCSEIIFNSEDKENVQPGFRGRVSLLQPDVSQKNCGIVINDLIGSDSGLYQLRVVGKINQKEDGFTYTQKQNLSVKGLRQKPSVVIPPLTEGQQTKLTCTAPGLCSGSRPEITWRWSRKGKNNSLIPETAVTRARSSTLTFDPSPEHHRTTITCKVRFGGRTTTEKSLTLDVIYKRNPQILGKTAVKEGDHLKLTCRADSFPPSVIRWTKHSAQGIHLQTDTGSATLEISNVTAEDSGLYSCTATHLNSTVQVQANVTVNYKRKLQITGNTTIQNGTDLNLVCSADSFPPSVIKWTKQPELGLHHDDGTGSATLVVLNVTAEDSGQYTCTATYLNKSVSAQVDVTVTWFLKILNGSGCVLQSEVLTCMCVSEGFPLPTITWPLLKNRTQYSVTTAVSNNTVNSTFSWTGGNHGNVSVQCISRSGNEKAKKALIIQNLSGNGADQIKIFSISWPQVILAFWIGVLLSATSSCLVIKCSRKKQKDSRFLKDNMEITFQDHPQIHSGRRVQAGQSTFQEEAATRVAAECNNGPKDLVYASINYGLLYKRPRAAVKNKVKTNTIYTEVKVERTKMENGAGDVVAEEDRETKDCVQTVEEPTYASVKD